MHPLQSCDFCTAEAAGTFEILPPVLEPTADEQRRVVLCAECKSRLETVLEPLIARLGADAPESAIDETDSTSATPGNDSQPTGSIVASADASTEKRRRRRSPNASVAETESDSQRSITLDPDESPEPTMDVESDETDPTTADAGADDTTVTAPRAYNKVIRLLRNREFPMERDAVETLAASAYDLESHEAEAIVDHAIEHDELLEDGRQLRQPGR